MRKINLETVRKERQYIPCSRKVITGKERRELQETEGTEKGKAYEKKNQNRISKQQMENRVPTEGSDQQLDEDKDR